MIAATSNVFATNISSLPAVITVEIVVIAFLLAGLMSTRRFFSRFLVAAFLLIIMRAAIALTANFYHWDVLVNAATNNTMIAVTYGTCILLLCREITIGNGLWREVIRSVNRFYNNRKVYVAAMKEQKKNRSSP